MYNSFDVCLSKLSFIYFHTASEKGPRYDIREENKGLTEIK